MVEQQHRLAHFDIVKADPAGIAGPRVGSHSYGPVGGKSMVGKANEGSEGGGIEAFDMIGHELGLGRAL